MSACYYFLNLLQDYKDENNVGYVYTSYKFGELLSSISADNAGIDQHSGYHSSTFTRGQHICVSLFLARRRHCYAASTIRWALPRISS